MNKALYIFITLILTIAISACSAGGQEKATEEEVKSQIKSDEERMDSLEKAIQLQMEAVSDDSIVNQTIAP